MPTITPVMIISSIMTFATVISEDLSKTKSALKYYLNTSKKFYFLIFHSNFSSKKQFLFGSDATSVKSRCDVAIKDM